MDELVERLRRNAATGTELGRPVTQLAVERLKRGGLNVSRLERFHLEKDGVQHRLPFLVVRERLRATLALDEELDAAPHAVRLNDAHHGTDGVQVVGGRVVYVLSLGYGEETPVAVQCLLHRLDGSGSPRRDGHSDPGVHDGITKGQDRQRETLRHQILFLVSLDVVDAGGRLVFRQSECSSVR